MKNFQLAGEECKQKFGKQLKASAIQNLWAVISDNNNNCGSLGTPKIVTKSSESS